MGQPAEVVTVSSISQARIKSFMDDPIVCVRSDGRRSYCRSWERDSG